MREVESAIAQLEQKLGRQPSEAEVAKALSLSLEGYYEKLSHCSGHQLVYYEDFQDAESQGEHFLDRFVKDDDNPLQALLESDFKDALVNAIESLPEREKILMGLYYEQELNLKEIGAIMNVSESRVCQLHTQAVSRLRSTLKEQAWTGAA
jgi:RNA polymerase sigma factor for flagellar operon FliA